MDRLRGIRSRCLTIFLLQCPTPRHRLLNSFFAEGENRKRRGFGSQKSIEAGRQAIPADRRGSCRIPVQARRIFQTQGKYISIQRNRTGWKRRRKRMPIVGENNDYIMKTQPMMPLPGKFHSALLLIYNSSKTTSVNRLLLHTVKIFFSLSGKATKGGRGKKALGFFLNSREPWCFGMSGRSAAGGSIGKKLSIISYYLYVIFITK